MSFMSKKLCLSVLLASSLAAPLVSMAIEANQVQSDGFTLAKVSDPFSETVLKGSLRKAGVSDGVIAEMVQAGKTEVLTLPPGVPVPASSSRFARLDVRDMFTEDTLQYIASNPYATPVLQAGRLKGLSLTSNGMCAIAPYGYRCLRRYIPNNNP